MRPELRHNTGMFKLLVANGGEIAIRVARAAAEMGIVPRDRRRNRPFRYPVLGDPRARFVAAA